MDIQQLRYVVALSQELHFQRAAQKVNVTQPTLSQQVKKLEDELGAPLFERSPQKVVMTSQGKKFIPHAIFILDRLKKSIHEIKDESKGEVKGTVSVSAIPTICPYLMPQVITRIKKEAPGLVIELYEETTETTLELLKNGKIDLGVLALPITDRGIASLSFGSEAFYLALSKKHPLASKKKVSVRDVTKEKLLILQEGHCFSQQALDFCKLSRKDSHVIFQGSSLSSVMKLSQSNEGITFIPKMALDSYSSPSLKYIPFNSPEPTRELGVIWRLTAPLNRAQRFLMDTIEKTLADLR